MRESRNELSFLCHVDLYGMESIRVHAENHSRTRKRIFDMHEMGEKMNIGQLTKKLNLEEKRLVQRTQESKLVNEIASLTGSVMTIQKIKRWLIDSKKNK